MKKQDIEYLRNLLSKQMKDLLAQADETRAGMKNPDNYMPDPLDQASFDTNRAFMLRIRDRESRLFKKILSALDRLEDGTYGICEMCGEEISIERLKARPVTTYCIKCKTSMEALEKLKIGGTGWKQR